MKIHKFILYIIKDLPKLINIILLYLRELEL